MRFAEVGLLRGMYKALRAEENIALSSGLSEEVVQQYIDIRIEEFQKWLDDSRKNILVKLQVVTDESHDRTTH